MAYEELVRRYQDVAVRTAHVIAPAADADDAAQEAFVKAWIALPRFRHGSPFRPWLLQIVANEARNRRRSAGRREGLAIWNGVARAGLPELLAHPADRFRAGVGNGDGDESIRYGAESPCAGSFELCTPHSALRTPI